MQTDPPPSSVLSDAERAELERRGLPRARQLRIVAVVAAIALGLILLSWGASRLSAKAPEPDAATAAPGGAFHVSAAQFATLTVEPVRSLPFRGEEFTDGKIALNADTTTLVFSPYSGRITRLLAGLGDVVRKGAPLAEIEATEFVQAQADLLNATAQLQLATASEARRHAAFEAKGGSMADWQQAQADLAVARTALDAVRDRLRIFGESEAEIDGLARAQRPQSLTFVTAPIDGVVTDRQLGPGQFIQAGASTPVFTLGDLTTVWLVANVREADAASIRRGQSVEVHVPALPDALFTAKLTQVGAVVDPATHRIPVRAVLDNRDGRLKPEMFASFSIITSEASDAPGVPEDAVVHEGDKARVWVVAGDNALALREIVVGRTNHGMVEVRSGLAVGERIVTRGSLFIDRAARPG